MASSVTTHNIQPNHSFLVCGLEYPRGEPEAMPGDNKIQRHEDAINKSCIQIWEEGGMQQ